jgi:hypothetical protein
MSFTMNQEVIFKKYGQAKSDGRTSRTSRKSLIDTPPDWALSTSHGWSRIQFHKHIALKILWIVCVIASWVVCVYHANMILSAYLLMPISTYGRITENMNFEFPAVTICNLNMVRKSAIVNKPGMEFLNEFLVPGYEFRDVAEHLESKRWEILLNDYCFI